MFFRTILPLSSILLLAALTQERAPDPLDPSRDLASLAPAEAVVFVEAPALSRVAELGLAHPFARAVLGSELGRALESALGKSAAQGLAQVDALVGRPLLPTISALSRRGAALAVRTDGDKARSLLLLRAESAEVARETVTSLLSVAAERSGFPHALDQSTHLLGAEMWKAGPEFAVAVRDSLVLAGNDVEIVRASLDLAAHVDARGLAGDARFAAVNAKRTGEALVWSWIDMAKLEEFQTRTKSGDDGVRKLRAMLRDPAVQMLFGPGLSAIGSGSALILALDARGEDLLLKAVAVGVEAGAAKALMPREAAQVARIPIADPVAEACLYRDFAGVLQHRVELFAPETLPGFAEAMGNLSLLFAGMDVARDVLPSVSPWVRVVAAPIEFSRGARPDQPLPAAAAIFELREAERVGPQLVSAFQTGIGLVNVDRAQKGLDALRMELELVGARQMTAARFAAPREGEGEGVDLRYNFAPACAWVGSRFVLGTHAELVARLVAELDRSSATESAHEFLALRGPALARVLEANREALVANAVLKEGKTRERAEGDVRAIVAASRLVESLRFELEYAKESEIALTAAVDLTAARD